MQLLRIKFDFVEVFRFVLRICRRLMNAVNARLLTQSPGRPATIGVALYCSHSRKSISMVLPAPRSFIPYGDVTGLDSIRD